jgi:SAM-dependent methyltransferase
MLEKARAWNAFPDRCTYHHNERPDLQLFPSQSFDFVCSLLTLQHMEPEFALGYVREFARLLAPGGVVVFQVPDSVTSPPPNSSRARFPRTLRIMDRLRTWFEDRRGKPGYFVGQEEDFWMEMYCVPEADVVGTLMECGLEIVTVQRDQSPGDLFANRRYLARRPD